MKRREDTLMAHTLSTNTLLNATRFSHNSIQGHHHSISGVERYADKGSLRWSMSVGCLLDPESPAARYANRNVLKRPILGTGMLIGERGNTLVISDMHLPYQHKDAIEFLTQLHLHYKFDRILNVGDLYDHHRGSYHESEIDSFSEEKEYMKARKYAGELQAVFPDMTITEGNHDCIPIRKAKTLGLSAGMIKDYNEMYDTFDGDWDWKQEHWFDSWGSFPITHPMVLNKRGRWDKCILKL